MEAELLAFSGARAAAAVPVPGDGGEDEVLAVLSLQPGAAFDPAALIAFLQPRMAAFMTPAMCAWCPSTVVVIGSAAVYISPHP